MDFSNNFTNQREQTKKKKILNPVIVEVDWLVRLVFIPTTDYLYIICYLGKHY